MEDLHSTVSEDLSPQKCPFGISNPGTQRELPHTSKIILYTYMIFKSALRLLPLRGWWTFCVRPRRPLAPMIILNNHKVDNVSKYVCPTFIVDIVYKFVYNICS